MPLWFASRGSSTEPRVPCQLPRSAPLRAVGRSPLSGRRARRRSMLARRALGHARSATFGRTAHPPHRSRWRAPGSASHSLRCAIRPRPTVGQPRLPGARMAPRVARTGSPRSPICPSVSHHQNFCRAAHGSGGSPRRQSGAQTSHCAPKSNAGRDRPASAKFAQTAVPFIAKHRGPAKFAKAAETHCLVVA